jgi:hypothetical protein
MANPSLAMIPSGYKAGKLYSVLPQDGAGDFTVDRNGTATRVNSSGLIEEVAANVPRLDYTDDSCPVLLVEPQSTNYYTNNTSYSLISSQGTAVIDATESSNLGINVLKFTGLNGQYTDFRGVIPTGTIYVSMLVKVVNFSNIQILFTGDFYSFTVNIETQTLVSGSVNNLNFKLLPNGYTKLSFSINNSTLNAKVFRVYLLDDTQEIYIAGTQTEQNSVSSIIKTTGTTATRLADVITVTPPIGVTEIIETIDGVEQTPITVIPATYQIPNGNINKIVMQ